MIARSIAALICLGWLLARLHAVPPTDDGPKRGSIASDTIAAYEKLGAVYGGFDLTRDGQIVFRPGKEAAAKHLPGFCFSSVPEGGLRGRLPDSAQRQRQALIDRQDLDNKPAGTRKQTDAATD
jgi:hypothetical protein